jgi:hypothetical protein
LPSASTSKFIDGEETITLEQQYDYYRSTNNKIIFYALGIVVAFAITLVVQHADGKHILEAG